MSDEERDLRAAERALPRMYGELASWWPILSAPDEYAEEAAIYLRALADACDGPRRTLLELGSGGGNNAWHMKSHFDEVTLVDLSAGMLDVSRRLNPDCEHVQGDMRRVRLGRQFDCVFVHDAICHMTTEADLARAIETAAVHCRPGGAAVFVPDDVRENFEESTRTGGHDTPERSLRYLEWTWDPDPSDTSYVTDYAYLLREADGSVRVMHDRHVDGLFARDVWLRLLSEAGFEPRVLPVEHTELPEGEYELFSARRR